MSQIPATSQAAVEAPVAVTAVAVTLVKRKLEGQPSLCSLNGKQREDLNLHLKPSTGTTLRKVIANLLGKDKIGSRNTDTTDMEIHTTEPSKVFAINVENKATRGTNVQIKVGARMREGIRCQEKLKPENNGEDSTHVSIVV